MTAEPHDVAEPHEHKSIFRSESLVSARVCTLCGSYVAGLFLAEHEQFHESLAAANGENAASGEKKRKKSKKE
jgi:hypothetical protein